MYFYQSGEDDVKLKVIIETRMPANFQFIRQKMVDAHHFPVASFHLFIVFVKCHFTQYYDVVRIGWYVFFAHETASPVLTYR